MKTQKSNRRNPVARYAGEFNRASVQPNKKKEDQLVLGKYKKSSLYDLI